MRSIYLLTTLYLFLMSRIFFPACMSTFLADLADSSILSTRLLWAYSSSVQYLVALDRLVLTPSYYSINLPTSLPTEDNPVLVFTLSNIEVTFFAATIYFNSFLSSLSGIEPRSPSITGLISPSVFISGTKYIRSNYCKLDPISLFSFSFCC